MQETVDWKSCAQEEAVVWLLWGYTHHVGHVLPIYFPHTIAKGQFYGFGVPCNRFPLVGFNGGGLSGWDNMAVVLGDKKMAWDAQGIADLDKRLQWQLDTTFYIVVYHRLTYVAASGYLRNGYIHYNW